MLTSCPFTKPLSWTSCKKLEQRRDCSSHQPSPFLGGQKSHMFGDSPFSLMKKTYLMQTVQWNMTAGCSLGAQALPSPEVSCEEALDSAELELVCRRDLRRDLQSQLKASGLQREGP